MRTIILPLGALLALSLTSCSSSANSLTEPDFEPARVQEPTSPCELPGYRHISSSWYSSRIMSSATTRCVSVRPSA